MPATQKLTGQARLALAKAVETLETYPSDTPGAVQVRVIDAVEICQVFIAHFVDFNPALFLEACDIGHICSLDDGNEAKRLCDDADAQD